MAEADINGTIEKIEELRYLVSEKTYELLRKKKRKEESSGLEVEVEGLKKEMNEKLNSVTAVGLTYLLFNKKTIDDLRASFLSLPIAEKGRALEGTGEGKEVIDKLNALLRHNYEHRNEIATITTMLPKILDEEDKRKRLGSLFEGYETFFLANMDRSTNGVDTFVNAVNFLGFFSKLESDLIFVARNRMFHTFSFIQNSNSPKRVELIELFELVTEKLQGNQTVEVSAASEYSEEDITRKINAIVKSPKMQRWVLNTFKDEKEREDYAKYQTILTTLIRLKRRIGTVKQAVATRAARLWFNNERVNCFLETIKPNMTEGTIKMKQEGLLNIGKNIKLINVDIENKIRFTEQDLPQQNLSVIFSFI